MEKNTYLIYVILCKYMGVQSFYLPPKTETRADKCISFSHGIENDL